jgi:hypothetical protein
MNVVSPAEPVRILPEVSRFIAGDHKLFIDGARVAASSNETIAVHDPSTGFSEIKSVCIPSVL